jgi:iron complex outermembrane recepter protein|tara:strand:+ start:23405 stop:25789 length:2385 start_codon:yes stop_codon:yes gene_type:complete
MNKNKNKLTAVIAALITAGAPAGVSALETGARTTLDEIIVTASKRSEGIQEIPYSITAMSQETMDRSGISSLEGFAYKVPGLAIAGQSNGRVQLNIRGISSGEIRRDNTRASESVGIYFDEIPLSTALYNPNLEPFDLARVEVLRGPQGTLYGSGSLAGTIRLVSNSPVMDEFEAVFESGVDSVKNGDMGYSLKGALNIPLIDGTLAARIVGYQIEEGGWVDNLSDGPGGGDDVNSGARWGGRASLLWTPTERLSIKPTFIHQTVGFDGTAIVSVETHGVDRLVDVGTLSSDQAFDPSGKFEQWNYNSEFYDDEVDIANLLVEYDFDDFQLTSSTSYTNRDIEVRSDISTNNIAGAFFPAPPPATGGSVNVLGIVLDDTKDISSVAQEFRLTSTGDSDLQWIAGLYYSDVDVDYFQAMIVTDPRGVTGVPPSPLVANLFASYGTLPGQMVNLFDTFTTKQVAVFGEVSYRFADQWQATVGLRWFDVEQDFTQGKRGRLTGEFEPSIHATKSSEDGINPKFILSYEATNDIFISAQVAQGFRLGGPQSFVPDVRVGPGNDCPADLLNSGLTVDPEGFASETLWNYELAFKSSWADNRVVFNAAAFSIDYQDMQVSTRLGCGSSFTGNTEGAESQGVELELRVAAADDLRFSLGGSYTDTELVADLPSGEGLKGDGLLYVPKVKFNATMDYSRPLNGSLGAYMTLSYQYTSSVEMFYKRAANLPSIRDREADSYQTVNLRMGVEAEKWEVAVFANNLLDEYATSYVDSITPDGPGGWVDDVTIRPRIIGLNAKYKF